MTIANMKPDFLMRFTTNKSKFNTNFNDGSNLLDAMLLNNQKVTGNKGLAQKMYTLSRKNPVLTELFKIQKNKGSKLNEEVRMIF